jgi:hypothetical protein
MNTDELTPEQTLRLQEFEVILRVVGRAFRKQDSRLDELEDRIASLEASREVEPVS